MGQYTVALLLMLGCTAMLYFLKEKDPLLNKYRFVMLGLLGIVDLGILILIIITALGIK